MNIDTTKRKDSYIIKLIKGDVSLETTYWGFGVLVLFCFRLINFYIESNYFEIIKNTGPLLIQVYYYFTIAYQIFISIAIWNSAGKYKGWRVWKYLARIIVSLGILILALTLLQLFGKQSDYNLEKEISFLNSSLPTMVDDITELEHVDYSDNTISYKYKLINSPTNNININTIRQNIETALKNNVCNNDFESKLLDQGKIIKYVYKDKDNKTILEVPIQKSDCLK